MLTSVKVTELDLPLVKEYIKVDHNDDDTLISSLIIAAQAYMQNILGFKFTKYPVTSEIPDEFTIACLMIIAHWYEQRQIQTNGTLGEEISFAVSAIIECHKNQIKEYNIVLCSDVTNLTAISDNSSVTLSFTLPTDTNFNYINIYQDGKKVNSDGIITSTYIIAGLTANTTYQFKVTTVNLIGDESKGSDISVTTAA